MIDAAGITRLLGMHSPDNKIVSAYVTVPLDPAQRRGMPAHLEDVLARNDGAQAQAGLEQAWTDARRTELPAMREEVSSHAGEWLGRSVAIFACTGLGLLESIPLQTTVPERAIVGSRPYVRPLLAEIQRRPRYLVAVVDRRNAWLYRVAGDTIEQIDKVESPTVASRRFGGWHGLASYRNNKRARGLARRHYAFTAAALARAADEAGSGPIVAAGHDGETAEFLNTLPVAVRRRVAGTFVAGPHTTVAKVRLLADDVVASWEERRERELATALAERTPGAATAIGLDACVGAANKHAIGVLVIPDNEVRPGFRCEQCGTLAVSAGDCGTCGGPASPVTDVIEELAVKVTLDGGRVHPVRDATDVAARCRFPVLALRGCQTTGHAHTDRRSSGCHP